MIVPLSSLQRTQRIQEFCKLQINRFIPMWFLTIFQSYNRYSDERHSDLVRGIAWPVKVDDQRRIFSCGWDRQVIAHDIITSL